MKSSITIATLIALVASGWILSGQFGGDTDANAGKATVAQSSEQADAASPPQPATLIQVRVHRSIAEPMVNEIVVGGRTEASRKATLSAETPGRISGVQATEGAVLKQGQLIVGIAMDDRIAIRQEATAQLAQRELEFEATSKLQQKGFQSRTRLAESIARLDAAKAYLAKIDIDIQRTVIKAPFDGILQHRAVELGDYVAKGDPIATVMDLDPILIIGHLSERDVSKIRVDSPGYARLVTGQEVVGRVRYISSAAEEKTRTFAVELEVANPDNRILQGLTAGLRLPLAKLDAHLLSPAMLTLADDGTVGVKIVDDRDRVEFVPVTILGDTPRGMWIGGLPAAVTLITVGHEFVQPGVKVKPVAEIATEG
jgi:multidrug efflux system membrane fusion protein